WRSRPHIWQSESVFWRPLFFSRSSTCSPPPFDLILFSRNFLFDLEKRHHNTPVSSVRDSVKRFVIGSTPDGLPSTPAQPKIGPFVTYFCNTSPYSNPAVARFCAAALPHQLAIPSLVERAGDGSLVEATQEAVQGGVVRNRTKLQPRRSSECSTSRTSASR